MSRSTEETVIGYKIRGDESRRFERFYLMDEEAWDLKVNRKAFAVNSILDLNSLGMQLQMSQVAGLKAGATIHIDLRLFDAELFNCKAKVRWIKDHPKKRRAKIMGLQFEDPYCQIAQAWQQRDVRQHISKTRPEPTPEIELQTPYPEPSGFPARPSFRGRAIRLKSAPNSSRSFWKGFWSKLLG